MFSRIGTGIDYPHEEDDDELEDEYVLCCFVISSEFQITGEEEDDDLLFFDDFEDGYLLTINFSIKSNAKTIPLHLCIPLRSFPQLSIGSYHRSHLHSPVSLFRSLYTLRQCYRVDEDTSGGISLHPIGETAVPYPYLYIRIATYSIRLFSPQNLSLCILQNRAALCSREFADRSLRERPSSLQSAFAQPQIQRFARFLLSRR